MLQSSVVMKLARYWNQYLAKESNAESGLFFTALTYATAFI